METVPNSPGITFVYCGQMVGWITTPLGTEVGLGPGRIVSEGIQLLQKGHTPIF